MRRSCVFLLLLLLLLADSALAERTVYADQGGVAVFEEGGSVGLLDSNGDVILPADYDHIGLFGSSEWAKLALGDRYGVVHKDGHVSVECAYDGITIFPESGMAAAYRNIDHQIHETLIDLNTGAILMEEAKHTYWADAHYLYDLRVEYNDGWETLGPYQLTIYDLSMNLLLKMDGVGDAEPVDWGFVIWKNDTHALIDLEGNTLLDGIIRYTITPEGVLYVRYELTEAGYDGPTHCGLINADGIVFEVDGTEIRAKDEAGLYCVNTGDPIGDIKGCFGYVDRSGTWIIQPKYEYAGPFVDGTAIVCEDGRYHLIDMSGRKISEVEWSKYPCTTFPVIPVDCDGGLKLIDRRGKQVSDEVFADANLDAENTFRGKPWDTYGEYILLRDQMGRLCVIEANGTVCLRLDAEDWIGSLGDGNALWIETGGLWGLIELGGSSSSPGSWRISPRFTMVYDFGTELEEGVVSATFEDGGTANINAEGNPYAPLQY